MLSRKKRIKQMNFQIQERRIEQLSPLTEDDKYIIEMAGYQKLIGRTNENIPRFARVSTTLIYSKRFSLLVVPAAVSHTLSGLPLVALGCVLSTLMIFLKNISRMPVLTWTCPQRKQSVMKNVTRCEREQNNSQRNVKKITLRDVSV